MRSMQKVYSLLASKLIERPNSSPSMTSDSGMTQETSTD